MATGRIEELAAAAPELSGILDELRGSGLREPVGPDPLLSPDLPAGVLDEFLSLAVRECRDENLFGLALALPMCAFRRGAGYEALEYCLTRRNLPPDRREFVAGRMLGARSIADVVWAHGIVLTTQNSGLLHSFLTRHAPVVLDKCFDQLARYLLDPSRGPGGYTAHCVEIVLRSRVGSWRPFARRWLEWLDAGQFDAGQVDAGQVDAGQVDGAQVDGAQVEASPDRERPAVLYRLLGTDTGTVPEPFELLRAAAHRHVVRLVETGRLDAVRAHLTGMVEAGYPDATAAHDLVAPVVLALDDAGRAALGPALSALRTLAGTAPGGCARLGRMVTEIAVFTAKPGHAEQFAEAYLRAREILAASPGCRSIRMTRGIENPDRFVLMVEWETLEDHTQGFRGSERFTQWRALIGPHFESAEVQHITDLD